MIKFAQRYSGFQQVSKLRFSQNLRQVNPLVQIIYDEIRQKGPMNFPTFWHKCLLHEEHGYYMKKDVFNKKGDFITSVEISQMFCELIGVWIVYALQQMDIIDRDTMSQKRKFHIVEFGPGLGTLQCHIIRVLKQFNLLDDIQISFIEYSEFMRKKQQENVIKQLQQYEIYLKYEFEETNKSQMERFTSEKVNIRWFKMYEHMIYEDYGDYILKPNQNYKIQEQSPVIILAHEFFDALPVHIFEYDIQKGWQERLVDINRNPNIHENFCFVLHATQQVEKILRPQQRFTKETQKTLKHGDTIEVCPQGSVIVNSLAELIQKIGGCALFIDYGENHSFSNSIRAIANHKILPNQDILEKPGECDISAYVDFKQLAQAASQVQGIQVSQVLPQGQWLESMGINARLEMLCKSTNSATTQRLISEYDRLVKADQMGEIFKFFSFSKKDYGQLFPFIEQTQQIYY